MKLFFESFLFAEILLIISMVNGWLFQLSMFHYNCLNAFIAGFGEEAVFRVGLLGLLTKLLPKIPASIIVAALFSGAHYWPGGDVFEWSSFTFRFESGLLFAMVYYYRGFWTAGLTHSFYDLFVTFINVLR